MEPSDEEGLGNSTSRLGIGNARYVYYAEVVSVSVQCGQLFQPLPCQVGKNKQASSTCGFSDTTCISYVLFPTSCFSQLICVRKFLYSAPGRDELQKFLHEYLPTQLKTLSTGMDIIIYTLEKGEKPPLIKQFSSILQHLKCT